MTMPHVLAVVLATIAIGANAFAQPAPTYSNLVYAPDHWRQTLDLYLPGGACAPRPVAIYIHGGGWVVGDSSDAAPYVAELRARGFAVAALNYRYSYQAIWPAQMHDCKAAVRWLRAHASQYGLDMDRVAVFGDSAGAHLAAVLATSFGVPGLEGAVGEYLGFPSNVHLAADFYGPTDLFQLAGFPPHNSPSSIVSQLVGHPIQDIINNLENPQYADLVALVHSANPVTHITPDDPPFSIAHGDADTVIPLVQSELLHEALVSAGVASSLRVVPGAGHELPLSEYLLVFDEFAAALKAQPALSGDATCDGLIDVADLLVIISGWGSCQAPCAADLNADSAVDVLDLLEVISNWSS